MEIILAVSGLALAILGIIASYYFYKRSLRIKEPVYSIRSNNLISGSVSALENLAVLYKDYKVENLTVSKVLLYNRGAETITRQDVQTIIPLSISSETCKILDGSLLQVNNFSNNISVRYDPSPKVVYIDFDYLDKNQGTVIQVIHTGLSSDDIAIGGDIMGVQTITEVSPNSFTAPPRPLAVMKAIGVRFIAVGAVISMMIVAGMLRTNIEFVFYSGLIFFALMEIIPYIFQRMRKPAMPKGLEKFLE